MAIDHIHTSLLTATLCVLPCSIVVRSTALSEEQWEWQPHILSLAYSVDGDEPKDCHIYYSKAALHSVEILADEGATLAITSIRCALRPTRKVAGVDVVRMEGLKDIPGPPHEPLQIRVKVSIRKFWGRKSKDEWYDAEDSHLTPWLNVDGDATTLLLRDCSWRVGEDWDLVRLQIEKLGDASQPIIVKQHEIPLRPTSLKAQLRWNVRHNVSNTIAVQHPWIIKVVATAMIALVVLLIAVSIVGIILIRRYSRSQEVEDTTYRNDRYHFSFTIPRNWERRPLVREFTATGGQVAIALRRRGRHFNATFNVSVGPLDRPEWKDKEVRAAASREFVVSSEPQHLHLTVTTSDTIGGEGNTVCVEYRRRGILDGQPTEDRNGLISILHNGFEYAIQWGASPDFEHAVKAVIASFTFHD